MKSLGFGQGDGGLDEVEGAALSGGGVGEFVDLDVGVVVADSVAGEGREVFEQAGEAVQRVAVGVVFVVALAWASGGVWAGATGFSRCGRVFVGER